MVRDGAPRTTIRPAGAVLAILVLAGTACARPGTIRHTGAARPPATSTSTTRPPKPSTTIPGDASPGSAGLGDTLLPTSGNGGYDVSQYDLAFAVDDTSGPITATATITATASQALSSFHLDFRGYEITAATVDGAAAATERDGDELIVTPATAIASGATFTTAVSYSGEPPLVKDASAPGDIGWLDAESGRFAAAEPNGAKGIFPCNDHPSDKALFTFSITAPATMTAAANGVLVGQEPDGASMRWRFEQAQPMATYLVQLAVGDYDVIDGGTVDDVTIRHVVVRNLDEAARQRLDITNDQLAFFEQLFGNYPFATYGLLIADAPPSFALETQTLTLMPASWLADDPAFFDIVAAHELAHSWFGDAVSPQRWSDIWLNEGFATYAEWMWTDHAGYETLDHLAQEAHAQAPEWRDEFGKVADPAATNLFGPNEYDGAALVLHALRLTIGDEAFFAVLRQWFERYNGQSVTTDQFEALAAEVSKTDLSGFFAAWVHSTIVPPLPG